MHKFLIVTFLGILFPAIINAGNYDFTIDLGKMQFEWKVDGSNLNIYLKAKTKGWVGVGFNPTKRMKNANILIGYVKRGKVSIRDDFGYAQTGHKSDEKIGGQNNITKISGSERGGHTELKFTIPLDSGDPKDSLINVSKDITMMFAFGKSDNYRLKHKFFKKIKINLGTGKHQ